MQAAEKKKFCSPGIGWRPVVHSLQLSVVLPAYNERHRIGRFLDSVRLYLEGHYPENYEVIVVDDGSTDGTAELVRELVVDWPRLRLIRHEQNRGKGAAVRTGMLAASGSRILFADADGAAPIDQEARLRKAIDQGADIAVGSRLLPHHPQEVIRRKTRGLFGRMFAALVCRLLRLPVRDTQCGFKMFRSEPARCIFSQVRETGYLFDLEVLALAVRQGYKIVEVPIRWTDVSGGHFHPIRQLPRIFLDLARVFCRLKRAG